MRLEQRLTTCCCANTRPATRSPCACCISARKDGFGPTGDFPQRPCGRGRGGCGFEPGRGRRGLDFGLSTNPRSSRRIRYAIDVYCKERQQQKAEDTLRKLWRAVEQSADVVMITDRGRD